MAGDYADLVIGRHRSAEAVLFPERRLAQLPLQAKYRLARDTTTS